MEEESLPHKIDRLMREAASIFDARPTGDVSAAFPKMMEASTLALGLEDRRMRVVCEVNLAYMNCMCDRPLPAFEHIDRAISEAVEADLPPAVRNFAIRKFIEIALTLRQNGPRARTYANALIQSAVDEDGDYGELIAAVFNLSVVAHELLDRTDWALALLSWVQDSSEHLESPVHAHADRLVERIHAEIRPARLTEIQSTIEMNRDFLMEQATGGFLPGYAPDPADMKLPDHEDESGDNDTEEEE